MARWPFHCLALCIGCLSVVFCDPAAALIVTNMQGTTVAPTDDPGWNNFTIGVPMSRNFLYLGDGWALSAKHVGPEPLDPNQTLYFSTGTANIIPGQNYVVPNPGGVPNPSPTQLHLESDLRLVRLNAEPPGMSSIFDTNPRFTIASQMVTSATPLLERDVTMIGHGPTRHDALTQWNASWQEIPENPGSVAYTGYKGNIPNDDTKRWGTNRIEDESQFFSGQTDTDYRVTFRATTKINNVDVVLRDTVSMVTQFNQSGPGVYDQEAQVVSGDSGSAVFRKRGAQWELIGIVHSTYTAIPDSDGVAPHQSSANAVFGNLTVFADLTYYRDQIYSIINAHPNYSVFGDLDLDGQFETDLADDMAAFTAGWGFNNGLGKGTIESWRNGDVSGPTGLRDGKTDVYDFIAFRSALNNPAAAASLESAIGWGLSTVPEPSTAFLGIASAACLAAFNRSRSRRRRSAAA